MKTIQNFINESWRDDHALWRLKKYSIALYYAVFHGESIVDLVLEYKREYGDEDYINWGEIEGHGTLTDEVYEALMAGEFECEPEYRLLVRCAEAEWEKEDSYWEQLQKELKPFNDAVLKER